MLVVNLFGAPGAGKSTGAAYIFSLLKMYGINVELITEYAKDMTWENNSKALGNQAYIFGNQLFKVSRCEDKVDVVITDSPLPLSIIYNNSDILGEEFNNVVMNVFNSYNNLNYYVNRIKPYSEVGRNQTKEESAMIGDSVKLMLHDRNIAYTEIDGNMQGYYGVVSFVLDWLGVKKERGW